MSFMHVGRREGALEEGPGKVRRSVQDTAETSEAWLGPWPLR